MLLLAKYDLAHLFPLTHLVNLLRPLSVDLFDKVLIHLPLHLANLPPITLTYHSSLYLHALPPHHLVQVLVCAETLS